jgi:hypothetical protein
MEAIFDVELIESAIIFADAERRNTLRQVALPITVAPRSAKFLPNAREFLIISAVREDCTVKPGRRGPLPSSRETFNVSIVPPKLAW